MSADGELVRRHLDALEEQARAAGIPSDVLARLVLQGVVEIWKRGRSSDDIASELRFTADSLDPEADFEFMRP